MFPGFYSRLQPTEVSSRWIENKILYEIIFKSLLPFNEINEIFNVKGYTLVPTLYQQTRCGKSSPASPRLWPKPIFFTRFNTLEIFYVRIILMVLRCVRRRCSMMTPNIFPRDFLLDPETGLAASQMSSHTFYVLDSWHQPGQGMRHTFAHSLRGLARIFGAGLGRIRGKCGLLVFIVAIKVI